MLKLLKFEIQEKKEKPAGQAKNRSFLPLAQGLDSPLLRILGYMWSSLVEVSLKFLVGGLGWGCCNWF